MKYSKLFALCILSAGFAFAQFPWEVPLQEPESQATESLDSSEPSSSSEEASSSSSSETAVSIYTPPPAPVVSTPAVETKSAPTEGKTIFDAVRGHAYNPYSITGAASTVNDLVTTPSDIYQQKFIYVSPSDFLGYTAFNLGSASGFMGLDNSRDNDELANLILGFANSGFGIAFSMAFGKWFTSYSGRDTWTTEPGDNFGFYFSVPMGSSATLYANLGWLTYAESRSETGGGMPSYSSKSSTVSTSIGVTGTVGTFNYDAFLEGLRMGTTIDNDGDESISDDTETDVYLGFNFSITALQSTTARVLVGFNNGIGVRLLDAIENGPDADNIVFTAFSPNILGEVALFDNLLAFAGARHNLIFVVGDADRSNDSSQAIFGQTGSKVEDVIDAIRNQQEPPRGGTDAFAGLRYQRNNWALEAIVSTHPFEVMDGNNIFAKFGGFVYF